MKIHMFGKSAPAHNPISPISVQYDSGTKRRRLFTRWIIILLIVFSPFFLSLGWAFYQLAIIGAPGQVFPYEIEVRSGASGWIDSLFTKEGGQSQIGDTLLKIRNPEWEQIQTSFRAGASDYTAPSNIGRLIAIQKERLSRLNDYYTQLNSMEAGRSVTRTEIDRAWLEMKNAEFSLEQLRSDQQSLYNNRMNGQLRNRQDSLAYEDMNRFARMRADLQWVVSPDSGSILSIYVKKGEYVQIGQKLLRVTQTSKVTFKAWLEPKHMEYAVPGRLCSIIFPDKQSFPAVVSGAPQIDTEFKTEGGRTIDPLIQVEVTPLEAIPAKYILSGMPFQLRIDVLLSDMEKSRFVKLIAGKESH